MTADSSLPLEHPSFPTNDLESNIVLVVPLRNYTEIHRGPLRVWMLTSTSSPMSLRYIRSHNMEELITRKGLFDYQFDWTLEHIIGWSSFTLKWWQVVSSVEKVPQLRNATKLYRLCILSSLCVPKCWSTMFKSLSSRVPGFTVFPRSYFGLWKILSNPHMFLQLFWVSIMAPFHWQYLLFYLHYPLNNFQLSQYWKGQCGKDSHEVCAEYPKRYPDTIEWSMNL
jgi:hypothetical protein